MKSIIVSETGVSEAIGFVLTLGIVLLASGLVYAGGLPILQKSMDSSHFMEMEESFLLLGQNINEVAYERGKVRTTELKILKGSLSLNQDSSLTITINGTTYTPYDMGSVEYYLDNQIVAYENGGIWTKYTNNDTIVRSKPLMSNGEVVTIPIIEIVGSSSIAGEGTTRVRTEYLETSNSTHFYNATGYNTTINITSSFYKGWKTYLEDDLGAQDVTVDNATQTVSAKISPKYIYVDRNRLNVEIFGS